MSIAVQKQTQVRIAATVNKNQTAKKSSILQDSYTEAQLRQIPHQFNAPLNGKPSNGTVFGEYGFDSSNVLISARVLGPDGFENNKEFTKARFNAVGIYRVGADGKATLVESLTPNELKKIKGGAVLDIGEKRANNIRAVEQNSRDSMVLLASGSISGKSFLVKSIFTWNSDI